MANKLYTDIVVYVDGALLTEETQVEIARETGSSETKTVPRGYAGETPGAAMTRVTVRNAVPAAGVEFDPGSKMKNMQEVELALFRAGKTLTGRGFIISDNSSHGVGQETTLEFTWRGPLAMWE